MACAPVSRRSRRWKLASLLALAIVTSGVAQAEPGRSVLVFPLTSHWVLDPVARAASDALPEALRRAGYEGVAARPDSPFVQLAVRDGWLSASETEAGKLESNRYLLGVLARTDAVLTGKVLAADTETALEAELAGTISEQAVTVRVSTTAQGDPVKVGRELADRAAASLTAALWVQAGADETGRREGAIARAAAGKAALAAGKCRPAAQECEAAVAGDPANVEYLKGAAEALAACGNYAGALARERAAATLRPEDADVKLRVGQLALLAEKPEQAEAAFAEVATTRPEDPAVLEGRAQAARARGDIAQAEEYYRRLIAGFPQLRGEPSYLATLLASQQEEGPGLTGGPTEQLQLEVARVYFRGAEFAQGVRALSAYHQGAERAAYSDAEYTSLARGTDEEMMRLARQVEEVLRTPRSSAAETEQVETTVDGLHDQSEQLADLGELIKASPRMDVAHRFRVLAYHALNESNFEALTYVRTNDEEHRRRSALLRDAAGKAMQEAQDLEKHPEVSDEGPAS